LVVPVDEGTDVGLQVPREYNSHPSPAAAHRQLKRRVVAQGIAIARVLVSRRDQEHPQPQHLDDPMIGIEDKDESVSEGGLGKLANLLRLGAERLSGEHIARCGIG
jgi:hypothetical protein